MNWFPRPALAGPLAGETTLGQWLDAMTAPARGSVVQVIAYRPSGPGTLSPDGPGSVFRLEPIRRTYWATGIVVGADGLVLACAEAAQPGDSIEIELPGGARTGARFLAQDVDLGLSLLRAADATGLARMPQASLAPIHDGEAAVVLGHRAGNDGPDFRIARVSGAWSRPDEPRFYRLMLGDCHGACGDAVLDERGVFRGMVVGIKAEEEGDPGSSSGEVSGDPFECEWVRALSSTGVTETVNALLAASRVPVGFLGVSVATADPVTGGAKEAAPSPKPAVITQVLPGSPADAAGIRPGDQIVSLDGHSISAPEQIATLIASSPPGREIRIRVLRDGVPLMLPARLADRSALDWMDRQEHRDAVRRKKLESAIDHLQRQIRDLDSQRRR